MKLPSFTILGMALALASASCSANVIKADADTQIYTEGFNIKSNTVVPTDSENTSEATASTTATNTSTSTSTQDNLDSQNTSGDKTPIILSSSQSENSSLGKVGDLSIVEGERPDGVVAYVKKNGAYSYLIYDTIMVKCLKGTTCVPKKFNVERLGTSDLYYVKVRDYNDWKATLEELKNTQDVLKATPRYEYGSTPKLN